VIDGISGQSAEVQGYADGASPGIEMVYAESSLSSLPVNFSPPSNLKRNSRLGADPSKS
jgi:hypothetical protein